MAEGIDISRLGQVHDNTPEEKSEAALRMAESAVRIDRWRKKGKARREYDLVTVLLSLGIEEHETPEHEARRKKLDEQNHPGKRSTQWQPTHRSTSSETQP